MLLTFPEAYCIIKAIFARSIFVMCEVMRFEAFIQTKIFLLV